MPNKKYNKNYKKRKIKYIMFMFIFSLIFVGIIRVFVIKKNHGTEYEVYAIENQVNRVQDTITAPNRGNILDRNGQYLAISNVVYNLVLDIRVIDKLGEEAKINIATTLSNILEIDSNEISQYFDKDENDNLIYDTNWKIIKKNLPYETGKAIEAENLNGVYLEKDTLRTYAYNNLAAQVIGFVRGDTKWGLESQYDEVMSGQSGRIYRVYDGESSIITKEIDAVNGNTIVTTLDLNIQQFAEEIVKETYENAKPDHTAESVSMIVMNPKTGEVLAMAEYPNFNLNNPTEISLLEDSIYKYLIDDMSEEEIMEITNKVWKNFSITETFEPGSTFKPLLVATALEENIISTTDTFYCSGYKTYGSETIRCHERSGHGLQTLDEALANSCNVAMMEIAEKMGREIFYEYQKDFGFGEITGIDLPGEVSAAGLLYSLEQLNTVELATSSFGQGFNSTSLQILNAFASIINGGNLMKPYLVSEILDENGSVIYENEPEVLRQVISSETSDYLREALQKVVSEDGTAKSAIIEGYNIGGKTGTAQQGNRNENQYTLSFIAYFPVEDPEYIAISVIHYPENYYTGSISAVPMIKELFQNIIKYKSISPSVEIEEIDTLLISGDIVLNDYTNVKLKDVINELNKLGIDFQISGGGDVVSSTFPQGGSIISQNTKIILYVESSGEENVEISIVPNLMGLNVNQVKEALASTNFELYIVSSKNDSENSSVTSEETKIINDEDIEYIENKVISQTPEAGVRIESGSSIKIMID